MTNPITQRAREFCAAVAPSLASDYLNGLLDGGARIDAAISILTACQDQFGKLPELPDPDAEDYDRVEAIVRAAGFEREEYDAQSALAAFRQACDERGEKS